MSTKYKLVTYRWATGERFCHLLNQQTQLPHQASLLYVFLNLRNRGLSLSAMQASLNSIHVLLLHFESHGVDLDERFKRRQYLDPMECQLILRAAQVHLGLAEETSGKVSNVNEGKKGYRPPVRTVAGLTAYSRMTEMASYLKWLAIYWGGSFISTEQAAEIDGMYRNIRELRPTVKVLKGSPDETTWSETNDAKLIDLVLPESPRNIFGEDMGTRKRNYLLIQLLRCLGKRRGEVLNIQRGDIKPQKNQLDIIRRPDAKEDTRIVQPKVKTREHTLAIDPELTKLILDYMTYRREVPGANKTPYLFVNHKAGPTQGKAMTVGALYEVFRTIKRADPSLKNLHPHLLRHNFNYQMSQTFDSSNGERNFDQETKVRARANGWSPLSKMAEKYNERHTAEAGRETGLDIQQKLLKVMQVDAGTTVKSDHNE